MPFNGSGTFVALAPPDFPKVAGTLIKATEFNNNLNDIFNNGLSNCMTRDGQSPATANLPMAGFKFTGVGNAVLDDQFAAFGQSLVLRGGVGTPDWDTLIKFGVYEATAASLAGPSTNFPPTSEVGQLFVIAQGAVIVHLYITASGSITRNKVGSTWSAWSFVSVTINSNLTLAIPGTYATINDAMNFLKAKLITANATVTIEITGTVNVNSWPAQVIDHPDSDRIRIIGVSSAKLQHTGTPSVNLIEIRKGSNLQLIDDLILQCSPAAGATTALLVTENSSVLLGDDFFVDGYSQGVVADKNSFIEWIGSAIPFDFTTVTNCSARGILSTNGSRILLTEIYTSLCGDGIVATNGGYIRLALGKSFSNTLNGILVQTGAIVNIQSFVSELNTRSGAVVELGGMLLVTNSNLKTNTRYGIEDITTTGGGFVSLSGTNDLTGNTLGISNGIQTPIGQTLATHNQDLFLSPAATFNVRFGTHSAIAAETVTGYITIKDAAGTLRKVAIVS